MEADDFGPFQAIVAAALSPAPAPPVPGRPSIAMAPVVSTPTPTAPAASRGVSSVTAHVLDIRRQIAEFRDAGLDEDADELAASLKQFLRNVAVKDSDPATGSGSVTASPPGHPPAGFSFSIPSVTATAVSVHNRELDQMTGSYKSLVREDAAVQRLRHTVKPDAASNAAFVKAVETILVRVRVVRPYGEYLASLLNQVLLQLDPTAHLAADACVAEGESTSWRRAEEQLQPFLNLSRFHTLDGSAGDLNDHVLQLRAAYTSILASDQGGWTDVLRLKCR